MHVNHQEANENEEEVEITDEQQEEEIRLEHVLAKYVRRHHKIDQIIGDKSSRVMTRNKLRNPECLLSEFEPKTIKDALEKEEWIQAMNEEIEQIEKNQTWSLVPRPKDKNVIRTKYMFRNKLNKNCEVIRSRERLV